MTDTLRDFIIKTDRKITPIFHVTGEILPMWHSITESGEHKITPSPPFDKDTAALLMRAYFAVNHVARYVFVNEAWQLCAPTGLSDDELQEIARHGLSDHPSRIEVLMYQAEDETGVLTAHRVITRPGNGHRPKLGPLEFIQPTHSEGRFVGMLPVRGTLQ